MRRDWKLDGWSLLIAFVAGFFVASLIDDWALAHKHAVLDS